MQILVPTYGDQKLELQMRKTEFLQKNEGYIEYVVCVYMNVVKLFIRSIGGAIRLKFSWDSSFSLWQILEIKYIIDILL